MPDEVPVFYDSPQAAQATLIKPLLAVSRENADFVVFTFTTP